MRTRERTTRCSEKCTGRSGSERSGFCCKAPVARKILPGERLNKLLPQRGCRSNQSRLQRFRIQRSFPQWVPRNCRWTSPLVEVSHKKDRIAALYTLHASTEVFKLDYGRSFVHGVVSDLMHWLRA